jgi:CHAD domain-containing protein
MVSTKWISDLTSSTPLADAARRALTVRLEVVREYLPQALDLAAKDPENVHQLRVGTRRARAAVDIFTDCLPPKMARRVKKHLRRVRRAAGEARDWDVFLANLVARGHEGNAQQRPGLDVLIGYSLNQRLTAQAHLETSGKDSLVHFDQLMADTVGSVQQPQAADRKTLGQLALPSLTTLLGNLREAAAGNLDCYEHLHQVRILGKRLRYAMEVFAGCFAPAFREEIYPAIEAMQEILGAANDSHVACGRLEAMRDHSKALIPSEWRRLQQGVGGLLRYHRSRLVQERRRFDKWLSQWRRANAEVALDSLYVAGKESAC